MIAVTRLMALVIGYFLGCFPTGYLVGKSRGVDIRKHGSGNTGTTNTLRTLGWGAAVLTFLGDCAKTILAIVLANVLFKRTGFDMTILELYAGLGAVMGHNFPFYFKFKGGKAVATTAGVFLAIQPVYVLIFIGVFLMILLTTSTVSIASMGTMVLAAIFSFLIKDPIMAIAIWILALLIIYLHRENVARIKNGVESRVPFGLRSTKKDK